MNKLLMALVAGVFATSVFAQGAAPAAAAAPAVPAKAETMAPEATKVATARAGNKATFKKKAKKSKHAEAGPAAEKPAK